MKMLVATVLLLLSVLSAWADCADFNREAIPTRAALQAAADEYKNSAISGLRDMMNAKDPPPIVAIAQGVVATSKMIAALDDTIIYLRSVLKAGCFGKDVNSGRQLSQNLKASGSTWGKTEGSTSIWCR